MNRTITFPVACLVWVGAVLGWAMALPIAAAGAAVQGVLRQ